MDPLLPSLTKIMRRITAMVMEMLWSLHVLVVLLSAHAAPSHKGLSCVNDFINNVSCTWTNASVAPGLDCQISGVRETWELRAGSRNCNLIKRSCKLQQVPHSSPGCSFVFENIKFHPLEDMPIRLECDGKLVENLTNYKPYNHIKMPPPGVPNVSRTSNETWISWTMGSPPSVFLESFEFQVQTKQKSQTWQEAKTLYTQSEEIWIASDQLKGLCKVRVRVRPSEPLDSHWSNWSPTASWVGATDEETSQHQDWFLIIRAVLLSVFLFILMLILYKTCVNKGRIKVMLVPNPSKYFHTLHSVHEGNLKKWLNPLPVSESFFTAQPCDHISPVEVCESWNVAPSTSPSPSSSSLLLHFSSPPSAGTDTSGIIDNSSSSSCFSNMGYFMSSSSGGSARTDPSPAYFTYQDNFHINKGHNLQLSFCPPLGTSRAYETLKREPQSPDSGFATGREDEEDQQDEWDLDAETKEDSDDHQTSPLFLLPLHLPFQMCPPSSAPPPPHPASPAQKSSDTQQVDAPVADTSDSYAAWPNAGTMCRASSMPVEPCNTGYLTLKELQTTFSNKSI